MNRIKFYAILNVMGLLTVLTVNYLANALPIGGQTTGEVSDKVFTLFTPAGYAFAIWGLIYFLLTVWVIRQFFIDDEQKENDRKIGVWFFINAILNSLWVIVFQYEYFDVSIFIMLGILLTLIIIYRIVQRLPHSTWFMRLPFSVYIGWISVATIVNVFVIFEANGIEQFLGLNEQMWAMIMLIVGAILGVVFTLTQHDIAYSLVFIWAFIAIMVEQSGNPAIVTASKVAVVLLVVGIVIEVIRRFRK
ncbi:tryptophan-rich sensory protein [Metabacillus halosaccharovorans]|uniref:Tryptophan-rich sensory protein n=1 Tax=Metabacillus halosaccharovorans TaxID=930124 RepID=A0ABT3DCK5_9BACI|nr:tryptophan-rich sensory protein [Metabacillus halosaccharovorans]MCV9884442.1 tryptophan-rich sensory protein [Metabacillus halosaccharovorans]